MKVNILILILAKDNTKVLGFGTTRVVSKGLNKTGLTANQLKGMSTLQNICGVKKQDDDMIQKIANIKGDDTSKSKLTNDSEPEKEKTISINPVNPNPTTKKPFSLKNLI